MGPLMLIFVGHYMGPNVLSMTLRDVELSRINIKHI